MSRLLFLSCLFSFFLLTFSSVHFKEDHHNGPDFEKLIEQYFVQFNKAGDGKLTVSDIEAGELWLQETNQFMAMIATPHLNKLKEIAIKNGYATLEDAKKLAKEVLEQFGMGDMIKKKHKKKLVPISKKKEGQHERNEIYP